MGRWYCGEGRELYGSLQPYRDLDAPNRRLHEIGPKVHAAMKKGDAKAAREHVEEALRLHDEILAILTLLETRIKD
jgi:hypothetical protein